MMKLTARPSLLAKLLEKVTFDIHHVDNKGNSLLHHLLKLFKSENQIFRDPIYSSILTKLFEIGADGNLENSDGYKPAFSIFGFPLRDLERAKEIIYILQKNNVNVLDKNKDGDTPVHISICVKIISLFLNNFLIF